MPVWVFDEPEQAWLRLYQHVHLDHGAQYGRSEVVLVDQLDAEHWRRHAGSVFRYCEPHPLSEIPVHRFGPELAIGHDRPGLTLLS